MAHLASGIPLASFASSVSFYKLLVAFLVKSYVRKMYHS